MDGLTDPIYRVASPTTKNMTIITLYKISLKSQKNNIRNFL